MFKCKVIYWKETGWCGQKDHAEDWSADTKEDLFLKMLKANNHIEKHFNKTKMNADSWRFRNEDWKLQDEYDEWWNNLGEEKREEIFEKS